MYAAMVQVRAVTNIKECTFIMALGYFVKAVETVLSDSGFQIPSPAAATALKAARILSGWYMKSENAAGFHKFVKYLTSQLVQCLGTDKQSLRTRQTKMWGSYHQVRTADNFVAEWKVFLRNSVGFEVGPVLFQFITNEMFKDMIKQEFEIDPSSVDITSCKLSHDDECALRYTAGYVCRKIHDKIMKSSLTRKKDLIITLLEFRGDGLESLHPSEDWTNAVDRGGLWHISDDVYTLFCYIEEEVRHHLSLSASRHDGFKKEIIDGLKANEDVQVQWCSISSELDDDLAIILRDMIVELYITIRGFAFASSCMELYKQEKKKTLQKSKATRRKVHDSQVEEKTVSVNIANS